MGEGTPIRLAGRDWIWLVVVIAGASVANIGGMHQMSDGLRDDMLHMDQKWQDRTAQLSKDIRGEIKEVQKSIPPDWFLARVEKLEREQSDIKRDFVRKTELDPILKALRD